MMVLCCVKFTWKCQIEIVFFPYLDSCLCSCVFVLFSSYFISLLFSTWKWWLRLTFEWKLIFIYIYPFGYSSIHERISVYQIIDPSRVQKIHNTNHWEWEWNLNLNETRTRRPKPKWEVSWKNKVKIRTVEIENFINLFQNLIFMLNGSRCIQAQGKGVNKTTQNIREKLCV